MARATRSRLIAGVAAAALLFGAAACSDDEDTASEDASTTTEETMAEDEMTDDTEAMAEETIVDIAAGNPDFSTLVELVTAAGLVETLSGDGPFTVFAPTNDAFAAVPAEVLEGLGADTEALTAVLTYHVVSGKVMAADLSDGQEVTTVEGTIFTVNIAEDGAVTLTDGAGQTIAVSATDIEASNGVIHVIDGVLLPGDPAALLGG
jgi:uncharacterized surface protein with fasciclin (FAS1) repeats